MKKAGICLLVFWAVTACEKTDFAVPNNLYLETSSTGTISTVQTLGGTQNDLFTGVVATADNGYVVVGTSQSNDGDIIDKNDTSFDYWVVKFDQNDTVIWNKTYGGSGDDRAEKIIQTQDKGYVVIGYSDSSDGDVSSNNGLRDFWIVKLDANGTIVWEKNFGFAGNDFGTNIIENSDGTLYAIGELDVSASGGQGNFGRYQTEHAGGDYWVLKLSAAGDLIWSRFFGGSFTDTAYDIAVNPAGELVVLGSSDSTDSDITNNINTYDFWAVKTDSDGNMLWQKNFGGTEIDEGRAIVKTSTGYVLVGDTRSSDVDVLTNNGGADIWMAHINEDGVVSNTSNFGGSSFDVPRDILRSLDANYIITGSSRSANGDLSSNKGQNDVWIYKTDANGTLLWETSVGGSQIDFAYQSVQLGNGSIVTVGESNSADGDIPENKGFTDALIIKLN